MYIYHGPDSPSLSAYLTRMLRCFYAGRKKRSRHLRNLHLHLHLISSYPEISLYPYPSGLRGYSLFPSPHTTPPHSRERAVAVNDTNPNPKIQSHSYTIMEWNGSQLLIRSPAATSICSSLPPFPSLPFLPFPHLHLHLHLHPPPLSARSGSPFPPQVYFAGVPRMRTPSSINTLKLQRHVFSSPSPSPSPPSIVFE